MKNAEELLILDGGTGWEIKCCGGPFHQPKWSALAMYKDPTIVCQVHKSFVKARATAITINTYAVVPFHLWRELYDKDGKRLLKLAEICSIHKAY
jgi:S-methylmethionine-dependent homocysteine/selenocysteine methylase